jgi:DNA-binding MarR family transcriptional regulator
MVQGPTMETALREVLCDELNLRMVSAVAMRPQSARELSRFLGIPVSRTYRRIKRLEKEGVIAVRDRVPSDYGKRENLYESRLKAFEISFEVGTLDVRMEVEGRAPVVLREEFREEIMAKLNSPFFDTVGALALAEESAADVVRGRASPSA